jgi:hypothetical protein
MEPGGARKTGAKSRHLVKKHSLDRRFRAIEYKLSVSVAAKFPARISALPASNSSRRDL